MTKDTDQKTAQIDRVLGIADQFIEDWHEDAQNGIDRGDLLDVLAMQEDLDAVRDIILHAAKAGEILRRLVGMDNCGYDRTLQQKAYDEAKALILATGGWWNEESK